MKRQQEDELDLWDGELEKGVDFSKITRKIIAYWPLSILCALILAGLAWLYLYRTDPVYSVNASVLIKDDDKKSGNSNSMLSSLQDLGLIGGASNVNNEQIIITSYPLVESVVKDLQLYLQFSTEDNIRQVPLYKNNLPFKADIVDFVTAGTARPAGTPGSLAYKIEWGADTAGYTVSSDTSSWKGSWDTPLLLPFGRLTLQKNLMTTDWRGDRVIFMNIAPVNVITEQLARGISADVPNKQTSIINLTMNTTLPQRGVDILDALIAAYQTSTVDDNNRLNDSTLKFINQRLSVVGFELDSIEFQIQNFKQKNRLADLTAQTGALIQNLNKGNQDQNDQMVQLSIVNSLIDFMKENKNNPRVIPASLVVNNTTLSNAIDNYNQLLTQRERLRLSATSENPVLQNTDEQIESLQKSIFSGLESIRLTLTAGIQKMEQLNATLTGVMHKVPGIERTFENYSRQQSIKQELYLYLLQKREEALIAKSSTLANSRVISPARSSISPIKPKRKLILLGAALIGLVLPFGYDRVFSLFNTKVRSREDILSRTDIPIIGEIGHQENGDEITIVPVHARTIIAEQFRALRANIQFLAAGTGKKVLLMTSSMGGEGKTFISSNLASVFALAGKKVLLMEMDLRKPKLLRSLGLSSKKGFTQYVIGKAEMDDIIIPSGINDNIFVVPSGAIPPNPSELLQHPKTVELFGYLRAKFDIIIVDTPPDIVSDAQLLADCADITLYIVRLNYSHKEQFDMINGLMAGKKFPGMHLVINDIKSKRYGGNYYGYGRKYGYGYGYYYGSETKRKGWWPFSGKGGRDHEKNRG